MSDVTVIGLGEMGAALCGAFLRGGHQVTIWNRTTAKAEQLIDQGAVLASSAAAAFAASPVIVICVSDYAATRAIVERENISEALAGRLLVQLSTGTPKEARDLAAWSQGQGAEYLDGGILAWPRHIGGPETLIYVSGARASFARHEAILKTLAGRLTYLGEAVSLSATMSAAILSYLAGRWIGVCHGALICEAEGLSVSSFGEALAALSPALAGDSRHMGEVIEGNRYGQPESTVKTAGNDIARLVRHAGDANISAEWPAFAASLFRRAIDAGHGAEEHAALIKVLRNRAPATRIEP
jgi:3-hydroxyisobutyrate dehydrogenase-like beta-hydroxyacid dehydrogenase